MTNDVALIDAHSGDWLNNYLNPAAVRSPWCVILADALARLTAGGQAWPVEERTARPRSLATSAGR